MSFSLRSGKVKESQGRSGEKCPFHLGQGKSGNIRECRESQETCNGQGKIALL